MIRENILWSWVLIPTSPKKLDRKTDEEKRNIIFSEVNSYRVWIFIDWNGSPLEIKFNEDENESGHG